MEKQLDALRRRARQLKEKRSGHADILDFYAKVKQAQAAIKVSLKVDLTQLEKQRWGRPTQEGIALIQKEDFPVDVHASISLFHTLCRIGRTANPHMAEQVQKADAFFNHNPMDLEKLLTGGGKEHVCERVSAETGLDRQILSFLIHNSIRPSIEAGMLELCREIEPETWRKPHCPVCGCPPALNVLKGEAGERFSICSYCSCQWRIDRLSCAACGNKEQESLQYFHAEREDAYRIDMCDQCHHYIKTIDYRNLETSDPCLEDLATLHLDILALQKGYARTSPNPWSA